MAMGRRPKPHQCSWDNKLIPGLYHYPGTNRWRVVDTGQRFTEADEHRAVARFLAMTKPKTIVVPTRGTTVNRGGVYGNGKMMIEKAETLADDFWPFLRELLIKEPAYVARMTGIPELAHLAHLQMPQDTIKLETLITTYETKGTASDKGKRRARIIWDRMTHITGAKDLAELTTEKLLAFREEIERTVDGGGTKVNYFGRIKAIIAFGLKMGLDALQIRAALDRCKVLWTATKKPQVNPTPISREEFHKLLAAAEAGPWRAWLMCGLNLCMHMDEVCKIKWTELDLEKGTYAAIRGKTAEQRIPRAATLWPETIAAIKALPRKGPVYVFTSKYGTKYNRNTRGNDFGELREAAGVPATVKWDDLRDGAFTAACQGATEQAARVLAGHKAPGLTDNYVLRNPQYAAPACDAVYRVYGPFTFQPAS